MTFCSECAFSLLFFQWSNGVGWGGGILEEHMPCSRCNKTYTCLSVASFLTQHSGETFTERPQSVTVREKLGLCPVLRLPTSEDPVSLSSKWLTYLVWSCYLKTILLMKFIIEYFLKIGRPFSFHLWPFHRKIALYHCDDYPSLWHLYT